MNRFPRLIHSATPPAAMAILPCLLLSACASLTGLDGGAEYSCKAPPGVHCESVSGNYANALAGNLPHRTGTLGATHPSPAAAPPPAPAAGAAPSAARDGGQDDAALRARPRVLRLWFQAWEDSDHDLIDRGYVYVQTGQGRWLTGHAGPATRDAFAPVRPPRTGLYAPLPASAPAPAKPPGATAPDTP